MSALQIRCGFITTACQHWQARILRKTRIFIRTPAEIKLATAIALNDLHVAAVFA
ncbi:MAG: hypothetical protein AAB354_05835 [candidate division KSB1 bacterium]